jgi:hypothetical protein
LWLCTARIPQAEEALRAFQNTGFDMKKLSIVGRDYHTEEHVIGFYNAGDRMKFWGKRGAFWGTFWGMLFGSALFLIPGVGHLMVLGPLVGWIVGALGHVAGDSGRSRDGSPERAPCVDLRAPRRVRLGLESRPWSSSRLRCMVPVSTCATRKRCSMIMTQHPSAYTPPPPPARVWRLVARA